MCFLDTNVFCSIKPNLDAALIRAQAKIQENDLKSKCSVRVEYAIKNKDFTGAKELRFDYL